MSIVTKEIYNVNHDLNFDGECLIYRKGNYLTIFTIQNIMSFLKMFQSNQSKYDLS